MKLPALSIAIFILLASSLFAQKIELLNVSYDPTREFYTEYNAGFATYWKDKTGQTVVIRQSHGGSGKQARSVIDGLEADVVTLALAGDIDALHSQGNLLPADWQKRLPKNSAPYLSTVGFLVRKGNPKGIKDWGDLIQPGVQIITPNPKTSGSGRWNFLAAWHWALLQYNNDEAKAQEFVKKLYVNVPVLDTGGRGSSTTFAERQIGDVLIMWENELLLSLRETGDQNEIVLPPASILGEPAVALVDKNVDRKKTRKVAQAYLEYLYSDFGQDLAGKHFFRPSNEKFLEKYQDQYKPVKLYTIDEVFGGWGPATKKFFDEGAIFDQIYLQ